MGLQRRRFGHGMLACAGASVLGASAAGQAALQLVRSSFSDSYEPFSWRAADGQPTGLLVQARLPLSGAGVPAPGC